MSSFFGSVLILLTTVAFAACGPIPEIFLPPDAYVVKIVGNGFSMEVNQLNNIKDQWKEAADDAAKVNAPRESNAGEESSVVANGVTNEGLFDKVVEQQGKGSVGKKLDDALLDWITSRATNLANKIERYQSELTALNNEERLVVQILLLNTLVDLDNLEKENIPALKWIRKKLRLLKSVRVGHSAEVAAYIKAKIDESIAIERRVKSTNKPPKEWLRNMAVMRRILHEQRFSDELSKLIIGYIGGTFAMMERSTVYDLNRTVKNLSDGLYYVRAKGRVPAHFPLFAQDAIANE